MSPRRPVLEVIEGCGVVAVVRLNDLSRATELAQALIEGGVRAVEYTLTNPRALDVVSAVRGVVRDAGVVGAGSILDPESARLAILADAQFVVTPTLSIPTIRLCRRYGVPILAGAMTPTEILTAWEAGADLIKVNPARGLGPAYFRDVLAPTPQVRLVPSGGVDLSTAGEFIRAGAAAIAVGGNLIDRQLIADGCWHELTARAREYVEAVRTARGL